jgi:hypothetical protein
LPPHSTREAVTAAALRGDAVALLSAGAYLPAREAFRYDRRRAAAFSAALAGERQQAFDELGLGGGVRSARLGLDAAVIELLTRGAEPALHAARAALKDAARGEPDVPLLLAACVRRKPALARAALAVAVSGGTSVQRTRAAAAVLGAARPGSRRAAVPALVAVSLAVAALAFVRLPDLNGVQEATPELRQPRPAVVVARGPERSAVAPELGDTVEASPESAVYNVPITVRVAVVPTGRNRPAPVDRGPRAPAPAPTAPTAPEPDPSAPAPSAPAPNQPSPPPASLPTSPASESPAARPAPSTPPAAAPPAEQPTPPSVGKPSRTARKAEKAERKAARKAEKAPVAPPAPPAQPATVTLAAAPASQVSPAEAVAPEPAAAQSELAEPQAKPDKPVKPEKAGKGK